MQIEKIFVLLIIRVYVSEIYSGYRRFESRPEHNRSVISILDCFNKTDLDQCIRRGIFPSNRVICNKLVYQVIVTGRLYPKKGVRKVL